MFSPVTRWQEEHLDYKRLLDLVEAELGVFHAEGTPDYGLLHDALRYLSFHPDRLHHVREDEAFRRLVQRDASLKPLIDQLHEEHRILAAAGQELLQVLEEAGNDTTLARANVEDGLRVYIGIYRGHMRTEEQEILPRAHWLLTAEDWSAVALAAPTTRDPLFGDEADEHYRDLRARLQRPPAGVTGEQASA